MTDELLTSEEDAARLTAIDLLTDSALAELGLKDLLAELLDRTCEVVGADTATVLLLERGSGDLVATASRGLDEEVRLGVRIPMAQGFAGRIAASRKPVQLDRIDATSVLNPILWRSGLRTLLGVPLISFGEVIGVLHVGCFTARTFGDAEVRLLQLVADRVALAAQSRRSRLEHSAAEALQRSLLPARFPPVAGLELAARYLPSEQTGVSGDWYDAFLLDSGALGIVIGDVVGHGLPAAVVMGRLRSALRAYALEAEDPAEVVTRLDRKIQHFEPGITATVTYLVVEPSIEALRISVAGHPPPLLAANGRRAEPLPTPTDLPLGIGVGRERRSMRVPLPVGTVLCLYTDGLVERRDRSIHEGIEQLCALVDGTSALATCTAVVNGMVGNRVLTDDAAVVGLRRAGAGS
ncbi:PP2C family protein-serine/threonine phosphatase [Actinocatenispora comari]|uniref:Cyclic diguanylate phosphodiesterase n=1 Tax=Actinocatenispora comari TaxID=2807577 RepID=A0A8J4ENF1_9ACTN|nr:GAF domain-containing SpoIIE family protein phosphatase [Actinocatenispora comari]GIL30220.1 cyclic diguanylate phosphodiesterase [Actinocatenispora comari]